MEDFKNHWGDGQSMITYREGRGRQPQASKAKHVIPTVLNPRTEILVWNHKHDEL